MVKVFYDKEYFPEMIPSWDLFSDETPIRKFLGYVLIISSN